MKAKTLLFLFGSSLMLCMNTASVKAEESANEVAVVEETRPEETDELPKGYTFVREGSILYVRNPEGRKVEYRIYKIRLSGGTWIGDIFTELGTEPEDDFAIQLYNAAILAATVNETVEETETEPVLVEELDKDVEADVDAEIVPAKLAGGETEKDDEVVLLQVFNDDVESENEVIPVVTPAENVKTEIEVNSLEDVNGNLENSDIDASDVEAIIPNEAVLMTETQPTVLSELETNELPEALTIDGIVEVDSEEPIAVSDIALQNNIPELESNENAIEVLASDEVVVVASEEALVESLEETVEKSVDEVVEEEIEAKPKTIDEKVAEVLSGETADYDEEVESEEDESEEDKVSEEDESDGKGVNAGVKRGEYDFTDEEIKILAQLMRHEAGNQSVNGQVAVVEVILNRLYSSKFPNTVSDVVYQDKQFTNAKFSKNIKPTLREIDLVKAVISGEKAVIDNENVMYFKNTWKTDGVEASKLKDWGGLKWTKSIGDHAFYSHPTSEKSKETKTDKNTADKQVVTKEN